jgi:hypothetical protein
VARDAFFFVFEPVLFGFIALSGSLCRNMSGNACYERIEIREPRRVGELAVSDTANSDSRELPNRLFDS